MQIIIWVLGSVAAYRLWENSTWLSMIVIVLVLSYGVAPDEQQEQDAIGLFSTDTATRLLWTFVLVVVIFIYSLFT